MDIAATPSNDVLAPVGPKRTAAHSSGGKNHKSSAGKRAVTGSLSNAKSPTAASETMISAASRTRSAGSSSTRRALYFAHKITTGVTNKNAVVLVSVSLSSAVAGVKLCSRWNNDRTNAGAVKVKSSGDTNEMATYAST